MNTHAQKDRTQDGPAVRAWLFCLCALVFAMIMVGGATRLTDSGLSITEWQLVSGVLPPLSGDAWCDAFAKYREIPEYALVNPGMTLAEFKVIYWWEWAHRFLGRVIGFAFLLPFLVFWFRGGISREMMPGLIAVFVLGGLQGALGWYMVQSGLVERVDVSQYRLAAHLMLAVLIFGYIFWMAIRMGTKPAQGDVAGQGARLSAAALTLLIFLQIGLGAFVSGLDAGQGYNTWPLIDGALVPEGLGAMTPWHLNLFENALTVQFDHRMMAYLIVLWALAHAAAMALYGPTGPVVAGAIALALAAVAQATLGIATLLARVPIVLGLAHQSMAIILLALALLHLARLQPVARE